MPVETKDISVTGKEDCGIIDITDVASDAFSTDYTLVRYFALLDEAEREAIAAGIITKEELQHWHANLEQADEEGVFFASFTMILVAGRKML